MPTLAYTPSVADVAKHLRARTRGPSGDELGTFTDATVPTDDQVEGIIDLAGPYVTGSLGAIVEDSPCEQGARVLWALKAAEMIEVSYYPEQLAPGGTVAALRALFDELLPYVRSCISGGGGGGEDGDTTVPYSAFYDCPDGEFRVPGTQWPIPSSWPWPEWVIRVIDTSQL